MSEALHRDPALIAHSRDVLLEMRDLGSSLVYAVVLTDDGFEVVHLPAARLGDSAPDGRLASMASSIQALSEAVTRELGIGDSRSVTIASDHGHVVQLRVPGHPLVLAALFDDDETLGKALALTRRSAEKIALHVTPAPSGAPT